MRRMTAILFSSLAVLFVLPLAAHQLARVPAANAHFAGTYSETYAGLDFRPLDSDAVVRYAGAGGGVWLKSAPRSYYLETTVQLPPGAQVTEVTFYLRHCSPIPISVYIYFIGYSPASGGYTYFLPETDTPSANCDTTQTLVYPIDPPVTIDGSLYRYALGYLPTLAFDVDNYDPLYVRAMLAGARVSYTIPGAFLPMVQK